MKIVISNFEGKEKIICLSGKGATLATHSLLLLDQTTQESYSIAVQPTEIYKIPKHIFLNLIDSSKVFRDFIILSYANIERHHFKLMSNQAFYSYKKMLHEFLLISIDKNSCVDHIWYNLKHDFNQNELSDILGISKTSLKSNLYALRDEGKIRMVNNRIEVKNENDTYNHFQFLE